MRVLTCPRGLLQVENTCSEQYGFIIKVFNINIERLEGKINPTGMHPGGTAIFTVPYDAIVFKPFRGEVLNGVVKTSAQQGLFVQCGPLQVIVERVVTFPPATPPSPHACHALSPGLVAL